jgi:hypothetical protein
MNLSESFISYRVDLKAVGLLLMWVISLIRVPLMIL